MARRKDYESFADRVINGTYQNVDTFSTNDYIEENIVEPTIKATDSKTGLKKLDVTKYPKLTIKSNYSSDFTEQVLNGTYGSGSEESKYDNANSQKSSKKELKEKQEKLKKSAIKEAKKQYNEKKKQHQAELDVFNKKKAKEMKKQGIPEDAFDNQSKLEKIEQPFNAKSKKANEIISSNVENFQPAMAKVNENLKEERKQIAKTENELNLLNYNVRQAEINNEDTSLYDKTLGTFVRGVKDLGSLFTIQQREYTDPTTGQKMFLPTKNELKQEKVSNDYKTGIGKFLGDTAYNVGKILGSTGINTLTGGIGGTALYWTDMYADSYQNAINEGYSGVNAVAYSTVATGAEYVTGKLLGSATKGLTGGKTSQLNSAISNATNKLLKNPKVSNLIGSAASEGTEEFVQEYVDNLNRLVTLENSTNAQDYIDIFTDKDIFEDALYSAGVGALSGGATTAVNGNGKVVQDNTKLMQNFKEQLETSKNNTTDKAKIEKYNTAIELVDNYLSNPFKDDGKINDELVDSYNSITPELQTQMQTKTQINPQQYVEEVRNQSIQNQVNAFNLNKNQYNTVSSGKPDFIQSARNYNIKVDNDTIQSINKMTSDRGIKASFDDAQFNNTNVNALWRINDDGTREVVFNPNANTKDLMENVAVHELYHDIANQQGNKYLQDLVLDMASTKDGYLKARESLANEYAKVYDTNNPNFNNIVNEEAVASILGEKLGNQEFINQLTTERRSVAKVIYDSVVSILNKLNKLTGYKSEKIYWTDVKNKFEKAYKNNNKSFEENTRFMVTGKKAAKQLDKNFETKEFTKNYNDALDMEKKGFSKEKIRKKTGWYKDINGDWKFEISDESSKLKIKPKANTTYKLSDLLSHDFIYDIYKNLGDTKVEFKDLKNKIQNGKSYPVYGYVNKVTGKMTLNNKYINNDSKILETLLHEVQHKIQRNEHFQSGTFISKDKNKYDNNLGEMEARETWARKDLTLDERIDKPSFTSVYDGTNSNEKIYTKEDNKWYTIFGGNIGENFETSKEISNRTIRKNIPDVLSKELDNSSFSFEENLEKYVYPKQVYEAYKYEDKTKITESIDELKKYKETLDSNTDEGWKKNFETNEKIKALESGFDNVYDYYVEREKSRLREEVQGKYGLGYKLLQEGIKKEEANNQLQKDIESATPHKKSQFQIIQETNPAPEESNYVWIRSPKDIKSFDEVVTDNGESFSWGDFTIEDAKKALHRGTVTVYSSYPIKNGVFVSTSYQQALDYAGGDASKVHSRKVALDSVAWINGDEGQYAKVKNKNTNKIISTRDSKGKELSINQQKYFKNSKVRDAKGNLQVMYHGTPTGEFNTFKNGSYFTSNKKYADGYQWEGASSISNGKKKTNPKTYEVYLNITNPFTLSNKKAKDIYLNEYIKGGNSAYFDPYTDYTDTINNLEEVDWVEGEDLRDWLQENHPEFDGLYLDEGGDGGYGMAEYRWRGISVVPFNANQIKRIDNLNPTNNDDIRYSKENATWDDFIKENFKNEGTGKRLQELKEKTTSNKEQNKTKLTTQEQQELNALESVPFELSKEEAKRLNELRGKANDNVRFSELINKTSYESIKTEYSKYKNQMNSFNTKVLKNAEKTISSNKQGRRTKSEWLDVAEHIGSNIDAKNAQQLEKYAIQSFLYAQPNRSENLNRQGKKYVKFTIEEWLQRVYKGAGVGERYSLDSNTETNTTVNLKYGTSSEDVMNKISRDNQSKFYENITERSKFLTEENRSKLSQEDDIKFYDKVTNKESMNSAMKKLKDGGQSEIDSWFMKDGNHDSVDVAEGWVLLKRAQDAGDYEMMSSVAKKMRQMGTKSGQAVQMYNLLGRLTPEGMVKYATSELDEAWNIASKNKSKKWVTENEKNFQLTPEETKYIVDQMNKVSTMEDGYEKNVEIAKVQKLLQDKLPPEKGQGLKAWMRISMLFNPKTQVRNVLGNAVIAPVNALSDTFASIVDKRIAKKTGIRTTGGINKGYLKGFKEGLYQSYNDFKLGINTRDVQGNRFEVGQGKSFNENHTGALAKQRNAVSKAFNRVDSLLSFVLDAGDRGFYEASFVNSLNNQKILNNTNEVTQEMLDIATNEALSRTWQDNNNYTKFVLDVRRGLNKINIKGYGIGDVLIPFAKTPANLTKAIVDYSPIGLAKTLTIDARKLNNNISTGTVTSAQQHQFVQNLGKATAGTMLYIAGMALAQAGITTGANDEDKEVSDFMKNTLGIQPYSVRIGNRSFTYDWAQPIAAPFAITANINKALSDEEMTLTDAILTTLDSGFNILMEQSFVSGLQDVFNTSYGSIVENIGDQILGLPARAVPTFIKQINDLIDPYTRQVYENNEPLESAKNQVKTKLPKASKDLPVKRDTLGRKVEKYGGENNIFNVFLNPANTTKGKVSDSAKVIYEVYQKTKDKTIMPRQPASVLGLNNAEKSEFLKISGGIIEKNVKKLEDNYYYKRLDDEDKAEAIKGIVDYAYNKAKSEVMGTDMATTYNTANKALKSGTTLYDYYAKRVYENR